LQDYLRENESEVNNSPTSAEEAKKKLELLKIREEKEALMNQNMITYKNGKDLL